MHQHKPRLRIIFSVIGLACIGLSLAMIFLAPGTFWNWAFLLLAVVFMLLARRIAEKS